MNNAQTQGEAKKKVKQNNKQKWPNISSFLNHIFHQSKENFHLEQSDWFSFICFYEVLNIIRDFAYQ